MTVPTTLVLHFPWGRYHATPWGRHVNEGAVELPPSPWRLLRALYAVWRTRVPELDPDTVHALLARLAEPPVLHVPRHTVAHTRHYHPDTAHTSAVGSTDRTLDAFAAFGIAADPAADPAASAAADLAASWPFDLPAAQRAAFARLAESIPYLGRADSLCLGRLDDTWRPTAHERWVPLDTAESVHGNATAVLAPTLPLSVDCLLARPVDVRRAGLVLPTGTRLLGYQLVRPAPAPTRTRPAAASRDARAVRFAVLQSAFPPETDALAHTDLLRQAALNRLGRLPEERPRTQLGGRMADNSGGGPRLDQHQHSHFLPLLTGHRLTGLLVWTPGGLPDDELKALADLRQLRSHTHRLTIRLAGVGAPADLAPELCGPSRTWCSVTPFTPTRHPKRHRPDFLHTEITRELSFRGHPAPRTVEPLHLDWTPWRRYRPSARHRHDPRQGSATRPSAFLRLTFDTPLTGPLTLGHLSHFGLGLFTPTPG